jgi:hypothetical protein
MCVYVKCRIIRTLRSVPIPLAPMTVLCLVSFPEQSLGTSTRECPLSWCRAALGGSFGNAAMPCHAMSNAPSAVRRPPSSFKRLSVDHGEHQPLPRPSDILQSLLNDDAPRPMIRRGTTVMSTPRPWQHLAMRASPTMPLPCDYGRYPETSIHLRLLRRSSRYEASRQPKRMNPQSSHVPRGRCPISRSPDLPISRSPHLVERPKFTRTHRLLFYRLALVPLSLSLPLPLPVLLRISLPLPLRRTRTRRRRRRSG